MKDILLSAVVISALVVAGIGGTLADFSDSEEEIDNSLQAGSLDLKVNGKDDPALQHFTIKMTPDKIYDVTRTVKNVGTIDGWFYIHIKNVRCEEANDKDVNGDNVTGQVPEDNPEPENVAQDGGWVGQVEVDGIGDNVTANCQAFNDHVEVVSLYFGPKGGTLLPVNLNAFKDAQGRVLLSALECNQIPIGGLELPACGVEYTLRFQFKFRDIDEAYFGFNYFDVNDEHEVKWNWWPTNAFQGDKLKFDILYELLQTDYDPPGD